ncbi:hypothetical protein ACS0TY_017261 [Phlomoides rotata]
MFSPVGRGLLWIKGSCRMLSIVPMATSHFYLCDNGYPNCEGFLTPYKGVRYHLNEWSNK